MGSACRARFETKPKVGIKAALHDALECPGRDSRFRAAPIAGQARADELCRQQQSTGHAEGAANRLIANGSRAFISTRRRRESATVRVWATAERKHVRRGARLRRTAGAV